MSRVTRGLFGVLIVAALAGTQVSMPAHAQDNNDCSQALAPRLTVGHYAYARQPDLVQFQGGPYFEKYVPYADDVYSLYYLERAEEPIPLEVDQRFLVLEGPACYGGRYLWRLSPMAGELPDQFWTYESDFDDYWLEPGGPPKPPVANEPVRVTLTTETAPPIVNAQFQIGWSGGGGGGGGPWFSGMSEPVAYYGNVSGPGATTQPGSIFVDQPGHGSIETYFPPDTEVQITIYQPDGSVHAQKTTTAYAIPVDLYGNEYGGNIGATHLVAPIDATLPSGVWIVEFQSDQETRRIAYELRHSLTPTAWGGNCEAFSPIIVLDGFQPGQAIDVVLLRVVTEDNADPESQDDFIDTFTEVWRWSAVETGENGSLIVDLDVWDVEFDTVAFEVEGREWSVYIEEYYAGGSRLLIDYAAYPWTCPGAATRDEALRDRLPRGRAVEGYLYEGQSPLYYAFEGYAGDAVTIHLVSLHELELDPILQLLGPDGGLLVENDDALDPQFGMFDSTIQDYVLPADGVYVIVANRVYGQGRFQLMLE